MKGNAGFIYHSPELTKAFFGKFNGLSRAFSAYFASYFSRKESHFEHFDDFRWPFDSLLCLDKVKQNAPLKLMIIDDAN